MTEREFKVRDENIQVTLEKNEDHKYKVTLNKSPSEVCGRFLGEGFLLLRKDGKNDIYHYIKTGNEIYLDDGKQAFQISPTLQKGAVFGLGGASFEDQQVVTASMPGTVIDMFVSVGSKVEVGDRLLVIESMKMENFICASITGVVSRIGVQKKQRVSRQDFLIEIARGVSNE